MSKASKALRMREMTIDEFRRVALWRLLLGGFDVTDEGARWHCLGSKLTGSKSMVKL
jgi:hypothetical protein